MEWIIKLFRINPSLDEWHNKLDSQIEKQALNLTSPVLKIIDKIYQLSNLKITIINLRLAYAAIKSRLSDEDFEFISGCAEGRYTSDRAFSRRKQAFESAYQALKEVKLDRLRLIRLLRKINTKHDLSFRAPLILAKDCKHNNNCWYAQH